MAERLLEVNHLRTSFFTMEGEVKSVSDVSYYVEKGEVIAIVGESGCGKSVTQMSVMQLVQTPPGKILGGEVLFEGKSLLEYDAKSKEMRAIRGAGISMIFQEPMTSLNPVLTVGEQLTDVICNHSHVSKKEAWKKGVEALTAVGIPEPEARMRCYPFEMSGGMRQRVMIAISVACDSKLIIADEPTTALDVTTQAQVMDLLIDLVHQYNKSLIIITHNLGLVTRYAQRVYVMYAGKIVESGTTEKILTSPEHPYTVGLLKSVPKLQDTSGTELVPITGAPPVLSRLTEQCAFLPRCSYACDSCRKEKAPLLKKTGTAHYVACHRDIREELQEEKAAVSHSTEYESNSKKKDKTEKETILRIESLKMYFPVTKGIFGVPAGVVKAVDDISFSIKKGETFGLVGESGCGKTTTGKCILKINQPTSGKIYYKEKEIGTLSAKEFAPYRREIQLIFQDPYSSLDPRNSVYSILREAIICDGRRRSADEITRRVNELLRIVELDPGMSHRFPHEMSGGQRQRLGIARALACNPEVIVCDEPVSALDVSIQAQIINLFKKIQRELGITYLFVAHDLAVVRHISDNIGVMYLGHLVEITKASDLYSNPVHPYTQALLSAIPITDYYEEQKRNRVVLQGEVPSPMNVPSGCPFHPRCPRATEQCKKEIPKFRSVGKDHLAACHNCI